MIRLEAFGETETVVTVAQVLDESDGVNHVRVLDASRAGHSILVAIVRARRVDALLETLRGFDLSDSDILLTRPEVVGRTANARADNTLVWEDVLGAAWLNARPVATYLAFMLVAGVIACYGIVEASGILIVGAMAVSPDLLPITAIAVALVGRRGALASRALLTLVVGLAIASASAGLVAWLQDVVGVLPSDFEVSSTVLGTLATVNSETFVVALVAGIAGMLALETRASAGVGVAISVTTIPAAAYLGVAFALGESGDGFGALAVLSINVVMLIIGASLTLAFQRRNARRRRSRHSPLLDDDEPVGRP